MNLLPRQSKLDDYLGLTKEFLREKSKEKKVAANQLSGVVIRLISRNQLTAVNENDALR